MTNVKIELDQAVTQLRSLTASMSRTVAELDGAGIWAGADADSFVASWGDDVHRNLTIAANNLDSVTYVPAP